MPVALVAAAVVGAGATIYASNKAADAAKNAANQNAAAIAGTQQKNDALFQPYVARGNTAGDSINALLGLGGDQAGADNAFQNYLKSSGYQFNLNSGVNAINSNKAVSGLLNSGANAKALTQFGQNTGAGYFNNYLGNLQTQQGVGLSAASGNASSNSNILGQTVANNNNSGADQAGAALSLGSGINNALGQAIQGYGVYSGQRTASSYGGGSSGGTWSNPYNPYNSNPRGGI
jgi:hypothetical protein